VGIFTNNDEDIMGILWGYYGDIMGIIFRDNHFVGMKKETFW